MKQGAFLYWFGIGAVLLGIGSVFFVVQQGYGGPFWREYLRPVLFLSQVIPGPNEAVLYSYPSSGSFQTGQNVAVELRMSASTNVTSLKAYLTFDPAVLQGSSINHSTSVFTTWWEETFDNATGVVKLQASEPSPGVSGNNHLVAVINFQATGDGTSQVAYDLSSLALNSADQDVLNIMSSEGGSFLVDGTAPFRSNASPTGELSLGTTSATLSLTTNEAATCRYDTSSGTAYASMATTFITTGSTAHSSGVTGLANGNTYSYYMKCQDTIGNANATDLLVEFSVASAPGSEDTSPPVRSNASPEGILIAGTDSVTLSLTTDEAATCKYDTETSTLYDAMGAVFSTTGGTSHSSQAAGLASGTSYAYAVRCADASGNKNTTDLLIEFSVASADGGGGGGGGGGTPLPTYAKGDLNKDGKVNIFDLSILLSNWGKNVSAYELGGDTTINIFDLSVMLSNWTG